MLRGGIGCEGRERERERGGVSPNENHITCSLALALGPKPSAYLEEDGNKTYSDQRRYIATAPRFCLRPACESKKARASNPNWNLSFALTDAQCFSAVHSTSALLPSSCDEQGARKAAGRSNHNDSDNDDHDHDDHDLDHNNNQNQNQNQNQNHKHTNTNRNRNVAGAFAAAKGASKCKNLEFLWFREIEDGLPV